MNNIANIFEEEQNNKVTILDSIMDDITLESAINIEKENKIIFDTYSVMSNIQDTLTNESGVNNVDSFIDEQLATIGLTKEYFGFEGELTIESALLTIESGDSMWKKIWEWIKAKAKQIKDWVVKVFQALFNKNKLQIDSLDKMEKIKLGKQKIKSLPNEDFKELIPFLKDGNVAVSEYIEKISINNMKCFNIAEIIENNKNDAPKIISELMNSTKGLNSKSTMGRFFGHDFQDIYGILIATFNSNNKYMANYVVVKDNKIEVIAEYIKNTLPISSNTDTMSVNDINVNIKKLISLSKDLKSNLSKTIDTLKSISDKISTGSGNIEDKDILNADMTVLKMTTYLQSAWTYINTVITKMIKCLALHMRCYNITTN